MIRIALVLVLFLLGALAEIKNVKEYGLRLVDGSSRCQGLLEIQRTGQNWTGVEPSSVPVRFGHRVCADLECGFALSVEKKTIRVRKAVRLDPSDCGDASLISCFGSDTVSSYYSLLLNCSDSVKLVGGQSLCSGSLQIRDQSLNQSWTPVCEGALNRQGEEVLCRELGCGAPLLQGALSPLGQTFHCQGHEAALTECNRTQPGTDPGTCSGPPLKLTCSEPLRLVGGASRCEGMVEAWLRGEWRPVMTFDPWDLQGAAAVCQDLDCGSAVYTEKKQGLKRSNLWAMSAKCVKNNSSVRECVYDRRSSHAGLQVLCSDSVKLVGGQSMCSGSLQIRDQSLNQSWTPVCEGALDHRGEEVLCRELGCGAPLLQGALSPLGQTFHCEGHEPALMNCSQTQTGTDQGTCSGPALNLTCSEPLRLVGGASRCEGTVEAWLRGEWRPVMTFDQWDLERAAAVCRDLDCGFAISTEKTEGLNSTDMWYIASDCVKSSTVRRCVNDGLSGRVSLQVLCSEQLNVPKVSVSKGLWGPRSEGSLWARVQEGDWALPGEAGVWVMMGEDFQIKCSVEPQHPGGYFQLISPPLNLTLPAGNHSAQFQFTHTGPAHKGNYTCVYVLQVFNHTYTSHSALYIYPGESDLQFLLRTLILLLIGLLNFIPYFYYRRQMLQITRGRQSSHGAVTYRVAPEKGADAVIAEII